MKEKIIEVDVSKIRSNSWNPNVVSEEDINKLKHSIELGYFQPLVLWKREDKYIIIDGEHRWKILKEKGYNKIESLVLDDNDLVEIATKLGLPVEDLEEIAKALTYLLNKARGDIDIVMLSDMVKEMSFAKELMKLTDQEVEILQLISKVPESEKEVIEKNLNNEENKVVMLRIKLTFDEIREWKNMKEKLNIKDDRELLLLLLRSYADGER